MDITTIIDFASLATQGMTDYQHVGPEEDAATAARKIVDYWEDETGLLTGRDAERWAEMGATAADMAELRGRCVDNIENAINVMRGKSNPRA